MIGSKPLQRLSADVSTWIVPVMRGVPMRGGELARIYNAGKAPPALVMNTAVQCLWLSTMGTSRAETQGCRLVKACARGGELCAVGGSTHGGRCMA